MKHTILVPQQIECSLRKHLFQNHLEQGAFLFSQPTNAPCGPSIQVVDAYHIPPQGWKVQCEFYLEMEDAERAHIMKMARDGGYGVVDCHSHPGSGAEAAFSPSDRLGITEFAQYAKWKLSGQPYVAMVWGERSLDAVLWHGDFRGPHPVQDVAITGDDHVQTLIPRDSWFVNPFALMSKRKKGGRRWT